MMAEKVEKPINFLMHNIPNWCENTLNFLQEMLKDFLSLSNQFKTLCIKGLKSGNIQRWTYCKVNKNKI